MPGKGEGQQKAKPRDSVASAKKVARTQKRKDARRAVNEARHQENLAYMREHRLTADAFETTRYRRRYANPAKVKDLPIGTIWVGAREVLEPMPVVKHRSPSTVVRRDRFDRGLREPTKAIVRRTEEKFKKTA